MPPSVGDVPADGKATATQAPRTSVTIVGIGASAGGLEAFSQLLAALPRDPGLALVLVQHLAPQHESALAKLLGGKTQLPVHEVTDGMQVEAGHVYVIPPNVQMGITDGTLRLGPRPENRSQYTPIDFFFRSLADAAQNRAIAVILSGTASDGALGVREIKAVGGITITQAPETAKYDGMPRAAIQTGMVDLILPVEEIATQLVRIARHPYVAHAAPRRPGDELVVSDEQLQRVFTLLQASSGVDFRHYKMPTVKRRIQRRLALHKIASMEQYVSYLHEHPPEVTLLYQDLLIHVTHFFREPESFDVLASEILPAILADRSEGDPIRIWVPGCSTGEEPYSVAIVLSEFLTQQGRNQPIQIFGTDVSEVAIDVARTGIYPENIGADVGPERLRRFFNRCDGGYRIAKPIRDVCIFARQDVTRDPPFSRLDLVMCRNVLIYMASVLQQRLMAIFHYALKPGAFLVLGHAETIGSFGELFELAEKRHRIYRKKSTLSRLGTRMEPQLMIAPSPETSSAAERHPAMMLHHEVDRLILDQYAPPAVVVDQSLQIVQVRGQTGRYLEPARGEASLSVMRMAREGLVHSLRQALSDAKQRRVAVRKERIQVKSNDHWSTVNIEVRPFMVGSTAYTLIVFEDAAPDARAATPAGRGGKPRRAAAESPRVADLQRELAASRDYLQSIIQELEAANEELQSANEEVLSSNEELQSTNEELDTAKEELQSTNEELNTVNDELHGRNEEQAQLNSDLMNLLANANLAIVMVSADLRIRRFTPVAERLLNLIPADIGRPIGNIKPNLDCPDLEELCTGAIDTMSSVEREVRDRSGRWYSLRIRPYKSIDNRIDGAVLTLIDVDVSKRSELASAAAGDFAREIVDAVRQPLVVLDARWRVRTANEAFSRAFGTPRADLENRSLWQIAEGHWDVTPLRPALERAIAERSAVDGIRVTAEFPGRGQTTMVLHARPLPPGPQGESLILLAIEDELGDAAGRK